MEYVPTLRLEGKAEQGCQCLDVVLSLLQFPVFAFYFIVFPTLLCLCRRLFTWYRYADASRVHTKYEPKLLSCGECQSSARQATQYLHRHSYVCPRRSQRCGNRRCRCTIDSEEGTAKSDRRSLIQRPLQCGVPTLKSAKGK